MKKPPSIPRDIMPQVDEKDIPRLIVFAAKMGYGVTAGETLPSTFTRYQPVDWVKAKAMPETVLDKPVLCTKSFEVIDGNHRNAAHEINETLNPYLKFDCSMVEALDMLNVFPFAYELTPLTPERN